MIIGQCPKFNKKQTIEVNFPGRTRGENISTMTKQFHVRQFLLVFFICMGFAVPTHYLPDLRSARSTRRSRA